MSPVNLIRVRDIGMKSCYICYTNRGTDSVIITDMCVNMAYYTCIYFLALYTDRA
jgi:hypothetical protein